MRADIGGYDRVAFNVKDYPQISLDHHRVNSSVEDGGKPVNFMGAQPGIKRIHLEDLPGPAHRSPLPTRQLFEITPELGLGDVAISH